VQYTPSSASWQNVGDYSIVPGKLAAFGMITKAASLTGDKQYCPLPSARNTICFLGGSAAAGSYCGVFCGSWSSTAATSDWSSAASLLLRSKPSGKSAKDIESILGNFADIEQVVATSNHAVGDYVVVDDKLRKVTAAIASGESINNNNSSVTTVEAEIASMKNLLGNTSISGIGQGTVTDAISVLNSNTYSLVLGTMITTGCDANDLLQYGNYYCQSFAVASDMTNIPSNTPFILKVESVTGDNNSPTDSWYKSRQIISYYNNPYSVYVRTIEKDRSNWNITSWVKLPTRSEIDNLDARITALENQ
jgi:hypothetical protein